MYERSNYILSLVNDYEQLFQSFTKSHIRNIKRAIKLGNNVRVHIPIEDVVKLAKDQTKKFSTIAEKDYKNFLQLYKILKKKGMAITYGVYNLKKDLIASCAYFFSHKRAYYILVGNHPEGRITGASHMMIDYFIKEHASEDLLLDFEGSNIKSLAFFYKSFGAVLEKYPGIKMNKLPGLVKLFRQ